MNWTAKTKLRLKKESITPYLRKIRISEKSVVKFFKYSEDGRAIAYIHRIPYILSINDLEEIT